MYERPEDISLRITNIATPMGVAAMAVRNSHGGAAPDITRILTECGSAVHDQFGFIRDQVDEHSSADHTELLRIKISLLRLAVQTTVDLIRELRPPAGNDEALIAAVTQLLEQCVEGVCEQYAHCQAGYFARNPTRRNPGPSR